MKGNLKTGTRKLLTSVHMCSDCRINMVIENKEYLCPKCGMVQDMIDGSD